MSDCRESVPNAISFSLWFFISEQGRKLTVVQMEARDIIHFVKNTAATISQFID